LKHQTDSFIQNDKNGSEITLLSTIYTKPCINIVDNVIISVYIIYFYSTIYIIPLNTASLRAVISTIYPH